MRDPFPAFLYTYFKPDSPPKVGEKIVAFIILAGEAIHIFCTTTFLSIGRIVEYEQYFMGTPKMRGSENPAPLFKRNELCNDGNLPSPLL